MMRLYDEAVFYDGYNSKIFGADENDGIIRHANHLYSRKLSDQELDWMGSDLLMRVVIGALCDNYDRIGNINLAFVPKGQDGYVPEETTRIELGRFITPFMDKNKEPDEVPYEYKSDAMSLIFRDAALRSQYDYYIEFELFGVPYAANKQVEGCEGRNDVFRGTLEFECVSDAAPQVSTHRLIPIVMKRPEFKGGNLNNYSESGTDTIGTCTKTYTFEVEEDLDDARLTFILSNHGANSGGEEYVRRRHLIYFDGEVMLNYFPGGKSCEPYREYNTQGNGIYGKNPKEEKEWIRWNNWCPGDAIPIREINLGPLRKGEHKVMVRVPNAKFKDSQGDFPVSMYVQGVTEGTLPAKVDAVMAQSVDFDIIVSDSILTISTMEQIKEFEIYDTAGTLRYGTFDISRPISVAGYPAGVYIGVATNTDGVMASKKFKL